MDGKHGTYVLLLALARGTRLTIGRLGEHRFPRGSYCYVGSAFGPGGVAARVHRHTRLGKARRWHIDTLREHARLVEVWYCHDDERREHLWAEVLAEASLRQPLPGFGSSDCRCTSHLFFSPRRIARARFEAALRARGPGHGEVAVWWPDAMAGDVRR